LVVATGNIGNDELLELFDVNLEILVFAFDSARLVELGRDGLEIFEEPLS
jgi:hypothetical protein